MKIPDQGKEVQNFRRPATVIGTKADKATVRQGWEGSASRMNESQETCSGAL